MDYGVPIMIAVVGPLVTGLVTAAGIALERRRTAHDLEVRRLRLVELARNQIEAVQPLLNSSGTDGLPPPPLPYAYNGVPPMFQNQPR